MESESEFSSTIENAQSDVSVPLVARSSGRVTADLPNQSSVPLKTPEPIIVEPPYDPPPCNFVKVAFGDKYLLMNLHCRKANFVDYLKKKNPALTADVDICDLQGHVAGIQNLKDNQFVSDLILEEGSTYIPCEKFKRIGGVLSEIRPCVENWQSLYPELAAILMSSTRESLKGSDRTTSSYAGSKRHK